MSIGRINRPGPPSSGQAHQEGLMPDLKWDGYYEAPNGDDIYFYRCDGRLICWDCWRPYSDHPCDAREECLTVLCNGWRVKL